MKVKKQSNSISLVIGLAVHSYITYALLSVIPKIVDKYGINIESCMITLLVLIILGIIIYDFAVISLADNYELILEDTYFIYRSVFVSIKKDYKFIINIKEINKSLTRFGGRKLILRIKLGKIKRFYIAVDGINGRQYKGIKQKLINKTGKSIVESKKR